MEEKTLKHYGIKGMRWGVRRTEAQLRRARGPNTTRRVSKEQYESEKQKAINSGNPKAVEAWFNKLTNQELRAAIDRVDLSTKLSEASKKYKKSGSSKVTTALTTVGDVTKVAGTLLAAYGTVVKINNTFNTKQLPQVNGTYYKDQSGKDKSGKDKSDKKDN